MQMVMGCCTNIFVLDSGELIAEGGPSAISTNEQVIEAYLGHQPPSAFPVEPSQVAR